MLAVESVCRSVLEPLVLLCVVATVIATAVATVVAAAAARKMATNVKIHCLENYTSFGIH